MEKREAIYFRREDYAPFWLRVLIDAVDGLIVGFLCIAIFAALSDVISYNLLLLTWVVIFYGYFVLLQRSGFGTLGYRLFRTRIVGPNGQTPSLWSLTLRLMFMVLGPLNYLIDLFWLSGDIHRQALRDKFAQTYVVKKKAEPAGAASVVYRYYYMFGYNFLFREIDPGITAPVPPPAESSASPRD